MKYSYYCTRAVASFLITCLLGIGGFAPAHLLLHDEAQHAHNKHATHGTVLCTWMCAAGQVLDDVVVPAPIQQTPTERVEGQTFGFNLFVALPSATSRGPPLEISQT